MMIIKSGIGSNSFWNNLNSILLYVKQGSEKNL